MSFVQKASTGAGGGGVKLIPFVNNGTNFDCVNVNATRKGLVALSQTLCLAVFKVLVAPLHNDVDIVVGVVCLVGAVLLRLIFSCWFVTNP